MSPNTENLPPEDSGLVCGQEIQMIRKAKAVWHGNGRAGSGTLSSDSGVLTEAPYSFKTRFESEKGTNPEELIAAAHAGCFNMALAFQLQAAGFTPTRGCRLDRPGRPGLPHHPFGADPACQGARLGRSCIC